MLTCNLARRDRDGLARIGMTRFEVVGARFVTDDEGDGHETPVKEMTAEQQVAFHQAKARKLEDKLKAFGGKTPEEVAQMQKDLDEARQASKTAEEKAIEDAKQAGRSEVLSILAAERVTNALDRALQGRDVEPSTLLSLDRTQFIDGDKADMAKITGWVNENTTAKQDRTANLGRFQGHHEHVETTGRATGEAEADRRFGKQQ